MRGVKSPSAEDLMHVYNKVATMHVLQDFLMAVCKTPRGGRTDSCSELASLRRTPRRRSSSATDTIRESPQTAGKRSSGSTPMATLSRLKRENRTECLFTSSLTRAVRLIAQQVHNPASPFAWSTACTQSLQWSVSCTAVDRSIVVHLNSNTHMILAVQQGTSPLRALKSPSVATKTVN
jgi:hypothetical protein